MSNEYSWDFFTIVFAVGWSALQARKRALIEQFPGHRCEASGSLPADRDWFMVGFSRSVNLSFRQKFPGCEKLFRSICCILGCAFYSALDLKHTR